MRPRIESKSAPLQRSNARAEFSDCAPAVLHLEDGKQITVLLRGEAAPTDGSPHTGAVIVIEVDDPAVALMDPQQLRERLSLNAGACWHQHWDDAAILEEATSQARETAIDHLALAPDGLDLPSDMPAELKSEKLRATQGRGCQAAGRRRCSSRSCL